MSTHNRSPKRSAPALKAVAVRASSEVAGNGSTPAAAPWNLVADLGRKQLAVQTEAAAVLFRGSEAMRRIQQQTAHDASVRHQAALEQLQASTDAAGLLAVQAELFRFDVEQASRYWQQLAQAAVQTQVDMMGCAGALFQGTGANGVRSAWQAFMPPAPARGGADA